VKVDANGLTGGPIEMAPQDHYGPSYWRLYQWNESARRMEPKSDWVKKTGLKFPVQ
jgi:branched-chain amino acid transport system substrate-binding protein